MKPIKGYYSLVQYCPDPARQEAVNVGVVFLCPETGFLDARFIGKNQRPLGFFGGKADSAAHLDAMKTALGNRLRIERNDLLSLEGFHRFVGTRANHLLLTAPKPIRTLRPEEELGVLYRELVEPGKEAAPRVSTIQKQLELRLTSDVIQPYVRRNVKVEVPAFRKEIEVPFAYQNGRFNLVQPVSFRQKGEDAMAKAACQYAVEGDSLFQHPDPEFGSMQLVVVAEFRPDADAGRETVRGMFKEFHVRLFEAETLSALERDIVDHGKLLVS